MARPKKGGPPPEEAIPGTEGLTFKQRQFVSYFLGEAKGNATEAARMVGYVEPNVQGPRLLVNVRIRAAIDAQLEETALSADEILARLSEVASVDMADFMTIDRQGAARLDLAKAQARGKTHLIKSLRPTKFGLAIELHDSQAAVERLGRYRRLFGPMPHDSALPDSINVTIVRTGGDAESADRGEGGGPAAR
jgi:hypothetical protein